MSSPRPSEVPRMSLNWINARWAVVRDKKLNRTPFGYFLSTKGPLVLPFIVIYEEDGSVKEKHHLFPKHSFGKAKKHCRRHFVSRVRDYEHSRYK